MYRFSRHASVRVAAVAVAAAGIALGAALVPAGAATGSAAGSAATAASTAATCSVTWGSTPKRWGDWSPAWVEGARAGRHHCYDRFVVDVADADTGFLVRYVDEVRELDDDGTVGDAIPLRGGAALEVTVNSPAYGPDGYTIDENSVPELINVGGYRTLRQVAYAGSARLQTNFGIGVRARLPFRAFLLPGATSSRVVVDVAHRW
jgi:hypothetical protein